MANNFVFSDPIFYTASNFISFVFIVILIIFIMNIAKSFGNWSYNSTQPILVVSAKVVGKRTHVSNHLHTNYVRNRHSTTRYYITFEVESGSRIEFHVGGREYGLLAEGDQGNLKFQGNRYINFTRIS